MTFVQYRRDIAFYDMNETQYPAVDARSSLSVDQYVQYILDNFKSVDEISASDQLIRLRPTTNNFTKIYNPDDPEGAITYSFNVLEFVRQNNTLLNLLFLFLHYWMKFIHNFIPIAVIRHFKAAIFAVTFIRFHTIIIFKGYINKIIKYIIMNVPNRIVSV